jgi:hypothetical protein
MEDTTVLDNLLGTKGEKKLKVECCDSTESRKGNMFLE